MAPVVSGTSVMGITCLLGYIDTLRVQCEVIDVFVIRSTFINFIKYSFGTFYFLRFF